MKVGDLVRHKLSERGMMGIIFEINETIDECIHIILWDDGRYYRCVPAYFEVISEIG